MLVAEVMVEEVIIDCSVVEGGITVEFAVIADDIMEEISCMLVVLLEPPRLE
jgi:hypothetical protein